MKAWRWSFAVLLGAACAGGKDGARCEPACGESRTCCAGACVNPSNDPRNCGACGTQCSPSQLCESGGCKTPPCNVDGGACPGGALCCGTGCCGAGQLCCSAEGPVGGVPPSCITPSAGGTCPQGCAPACVSDLARKTSVARVDERQVLERLAELPISTWSYTFDSIGARHIGPMAQDFHDAFSLGSSDRSYDPVDAHGVSLASLKALALLLDEQRQRIDHLEAENRALRERVCRPQR